VESQAPPSAEFEAQSLDTQTEHSFSAQAQPDLNTQARSAFDAQAQAHAPAAFNPQAPSALISSVLGSQGAAAHSSIGSLATGNIVMCAESSDNKLQAPVMNLLAQFRAAAAPAIGSISADNQHQIFFCTPALMAAVFCEHGVLLGRSITTFFSPEDVARVQQGIGFVQQYSNDSTIALWHSSPARALRWLLSDGTQRCIILLLIVHAQSREQIPFMLLSADNVQSQALSTQHQSLIPSSSISSPRQQAQSVSFSESAADSKLGSEKCIIAISADMNSEALAKINSFLQLNVSADELCRVLHAPAAATTDLSWPVLDVIVDQFNSSPCIAAFMPTNFPAPDQCRGVLAILWNAKDAHTQFGGFMSAQTAACAVWPRCFGGQAEKIVDGVFYYIVNRAGQLSAKHSCVALPRSISAWVCAVCSSRNDLRVHSCATCSKPRSGRHLV